MEEKMAAATTLLLMTFLLGYSDGFLTDRQQHQHRRREQVERRLQCYVCDDCGDRDLRPQHITLCPPDQSQSCMKSSAKFAQYTTISRSCSGAPAFDPRTCLDRTINIMRSKICLCDRQLCNGPSKELLSHSDDDQSNFMDLIQDDLLSPPESTSTAASRAVFYSPIIMCLKYVY